MVVQSSICSEPSPLPSLDESPRQFPVLDALRRYNILVDGAREGSSPVNGVLNCSSKTSPGATFRWSVPSVVPSDSSQRRTSRKFVEPSLTVCNCFNSHPSTICSGSGYVCRRADLDSKIDLILGNTWPFKVGDSPGRMEKQPDLPPKRGVGPGPSPASGPKVVGSDKDPRREGLTTSRS